MQPKIFRFLCDAGMGQREVPWLGNGCSSLAQLLLSLEHFLRVQFMLGVRVSFSKSHCFNISSFCSLKQLVLTELKLAHSKYFPCFGVVLPEYLVPSSTEVRKFYHPLMQN